MRLLPKDELQLFDKKRDIELKTMAAGEQSTNRGIQQKNTGLAHALTLTKMLNQIHKSLNMLNVYDYVAERCEITFRDQFVSRRDMF